MISTAFEIVKYLFVLNRLGGSGNLFINDYAVENYMEIGFVFAVK
jgi:hypothetical protein